MSVTFVSQKVRNPKTQVSQETIQKLLDENSHLIQSISDYQAKGQVQECSQFQQILHRNLVWLATVADSNQSGTGGQSLLGGPTMGKDPGEGGLPLAPPVAYDAAVSNPQIGIPPPNPQPTQQAPVNQSYPPSTTAPPYQQQPQIGAPTHSDPMMSQPPHPQMQPQVDTHQYPPQPQGIPPQQQMPPTQQPIASSYGQQQPYKYQQPPVDSSQGQYVNQSPAPAPQQQSYPPYSQPQQYPSYPPPQQ